MCTSDLSQGKKLKNIYNNVKLILVNFLGFV